MRAYKKYWIIGFLITVLLVIFLLTREHGSSVMSSKSIHEAKPIRLKSGQPSLHTDTKNQPKISIDSNEKEKQVSDNRYQHSVNEKEKDVTREYLSEEEIAHLLEEYLSQYEGNKDVSSPAESKKSIKPDKQLSWFMGLDGVRHYMRPGDVVVSEGWGAGTWNPRPRTQEEQRRAVEICQKMDDFEKQLRLEKPNPEQVAEIFARIAELKSELDKIKAETSFPSYRRLEMRLYRRDPTTGERITE